jgi:hypothetical protein
VSALCGPPEGIEPLSEGGGGQPGWVIAEDGMITPAPGGFQRDWRTDRSENTNPAPQSRIERHRYGDSNPGFRTENPAS